MHPDSTIIVHPANEEQFNALKAFAKALKIKFEISTEKTYNPQFVDKIQESRKQFKEGNYITVEKENLEQFLGLKGAIL